MKTTARKPVLVLVPLLALLAVLSVAALPVGWMLFTDPSGGSMQMSVSWLGDGPFRDYTVPGLALFAVLGVAPLVVIFGLIFEPRWGWLRAVNERVRVHLAWIGSALVGLATMIWIMVQLAVIELRMFLQPVVFVIGLLILGLTLVPSMRRHYRVM